MVKNESAEIPNTPTDPKRFRALNRIGTVIAAAAATDKNGYLRVFPANICMPSLYMQTAIIAKTSISDAKVLIAAPDEPSTGIRIRFAGMFIKAPAVVAAIV